VSFVIPAFQAARTLRACIESLRATNVPDSEIIVVDDGSFDGTRELAGQLADVVVARPCQGGAARSRNDGVRVARGDILFFVDADVTVTGDAVTGILQRIADGYDACFGAYRALPPPDARSVVTNYKNIVHHYTHLEHPGPVTTFWSGFGAVRRDAFVAVGGFDATVTTTADVEDIELGYRLHAAGFRAYLDPRHQVDHHKRYTFRQLVSSDILHRAVPWSRAMWRLRSFGAALNFTSSAALSSVLAGLVVLLLALSPWLGPIGLIAAAGAGLIWLVLNMSFLEYVLTHWGAAGAAVTTPLLFLFYLYAPIGALLGSGAQLLRSGRTSGLNWLALEATDELPSPIAITVAIVTAHDEQPLHIEHLPPAAPWWELVVVAPSPPPNMPVWARFVACRRTSTYFEMGRRALAIARGTYFAIVEGSSVIAPGWLDCVRRAAERKDLAVGGSFMFENRGAHQRAINLVRYALWRSQLNPRWMIDHPFSNIAIVTDVTRELGGFVPELFPRLARFGARPIRFDPSMRVHVASDVPFVDAARYIGGMARFRAAATNRYLDLGLPHRLLLVAVSPFSALRVLAQIVRSTIRTHDADLTFWLALPLTMFALASQWVGRDLGVLVPSNRGGLVLRTESDLEALRNEPLPHRNGHGDARSTEHPDDAKLST
jgi:GT2 family glycosyltransferase